FGRAAQEDMTVTFTDVRPWEAVLELEQLPGVYYAEPFRSVSVELRHGGRTYRTALQGVAPERRLHRILDANLRPVAIPPGGLVLTDYLADSLGVRPGDPLTVEVLEGRRMTRSLPVAGITSEFVGVSAYMLLPSLNAFLLEGPAIS